MHRYSRIRCALFEGSLPTIKPDDPEFVYVNAAFHALAHPPSRRILELLAIGPKTSRDLYAHLSVDHQTVVKALDELRLVGFVKAEQDGGVPFYTVGGPALGRIRTWLSLLPDEVRDS